MISFITESITINEPQLFFQLHLNRTGSLNYFTISGEVTETTFDHDKVFTPVDFKFSNGTSQTSELGYIPNDATYSGRRAAKYCLLHPPQESQEEETRFIHQCIIIVVYDEEDCK